MLVWEGIGSPGVGITVMALGMSSYGGAELFILVIKTLGLSER